MDDFVLQADGARKRMGDLPQRQPKRLRGYNMMQAFADRGKSKEVISWLHKIHGDAFTGKAKRAVREELGFGDVKEEGAAARFVDRKELEVEVVIKDFTRHAMELSYIDGLSNIEFAAVSSVPRGDTVVVRWEVNGLHTNALLGVAPTRADVAITGLTMLKFTQERRPEGGLLVTATDEWTYWDLPALMNQLGATP
jgi:hypothetical protein